jgi:ankyrin repeat protein
MFVACENKAQIQETAAPSQPSKSEIEAPDSEGVTALLRAIQAGNTEEAQRLIDQGANVNAKTASGVTPLMNASGMGQSEIVKSLLDKGADVNARTPGNYTPLMTAALTGQTVIVQMLLDAGADVSVVDASGRSAEAYAKEKNHEEIVKMIRDKNPNSGGSGKR